VKKCSNKKCKQPWKDESEFSKNRCTKDGLYSRCKVCTRKRNNDYYAGASDAAKASISEKRRKYHKSPAGQATSMKCRANPMTRFKKLTRKLSTLTFEQWSFLVIGATCHYCEGELPTFGHGLDRIDNSAGYELGNVVPCCTRCNMTRGDRYTYEEFKNLIAPAIVAADACKTPASLLTTSL
jgi:hypothetical protein